MSITADKLYVITAISNPRRYHSRYNLYRAFADYVEKSGAILYTVEAAFGERDHAITEACHSRHIQLRNSCEIWQKERMLNIALSRLPKEAKYIAWIDADVRFERDDWAVETIHMLQHHRIVQMFSHAVDLGPNHEAIQYHCGFGYQYKHGRKMGPEYVHWHPGFAWAARRDSLDRVGGLIDTAILGAGDNHMAHAIIGKVDKSFAPGISEGYKRPLLRWQERAAAAFDGDMGYVAGLIRHQWHGPKADRQYWDRWKILVKTQFDPELDVVKDLEGLWVLAGNKPELRDRLRVYFESRHEDCNRAEPFFGR